MLGSLHNRVLLSLYTQPLHGKNTEAERIFDAVLLCVRFVVAALGPG